jgi:hypothetical protein
VVAQPSPELNAALVSSVLASLAPAPGAVPSAATAAAAAAALKAAADLELRKDGGLLEDWMSGGEEEFDNDQEPDAGPIGKAGSAPPPYCSPSVSSDLSDDEDK